MRRGPVPGSAERSPPEFRNGQDVAARLGVVAMPRLCDDLGTPTRGKQVSLCGEGTSFLWEEPDPPLSLAAWCTPAPGSCHCVTGVGTPEPGRAHAPPSARGSSQATAARGAWVPRVGLSRRRGPRLSPYWLPGLVMDTCSSQSRA